MKLKKHILVSILLASGISYPLAVLADSSSLHFNNAVEFQLKGNTDAAIAEYKRGLQDSPGAVQAHLQLGTILLEDMGDVEGAISEFVTALGIDPECSACKLKLDQALQILKVPAQDLIRTGNTLYMTPGKLKKAAAAYKIVTRLHPNEADGHNSLSWTLYRIGNLEESLKEVKEALRIKPNEAEYVNTLACIQFDMGDSDAAIATWKKAISLSKNPNPADLYGLAVGYLSKGDKANATKYFKEAVSMDGKYADHDYLSDNVGMSINTLARHDKLLSLLNEEQDKQDKHEK